MNKIFLAGGCFWCIADYLSSFEGIIDVKAGYSGGDEKYSSYEDVKAQRTGHRETIEILYDETKITKDEIINIYFSYVDPFDAEGQFIDKGFSYTLAMYYQDEEEKEFFIKKRDEFQKSVELPIFIAIEPFKFFIDAEEYHQHYASKNKDAFIEELKASNRTCHLAKYKKN